MKELKVDYTGRTFSPAQVQMIQKTGTPEQLKALEIWIDSQDLKDFEITEEGEKHLKNVHQAKEEKDPLESFLLKQFKPNANRVPVDLTYEAAKRAFWKIYKNIIIRETGKQPIEVSKSKAIILENVVRWLILDEGVYNNRKSLFFFGSKGHGKSTLSESIFLFSKYCIDVYDWNYHRMQFCNFENMFIECRVNQNFEFINNFKNGGWILDELKEDHFSYNHYGNDRAVLNDVISYRHNAWKRGKRSVITTNLSPDEFKKRLKDSRLSGDGDDKQRMDQEYQFILVDDINFRNL